MTEVQKIKQALDPELFVKAVARWQKEDEAARRAANKVVRFPGAWPEAPQKPQPPQEKKQQEPEDRADPNLVFSVLLAAFGMFCLAVALLV